MFTEGMEQCLFPPDRLEHSGFMGHWVEYTEGLVSVMGNN